VNWTAEATIKMDAILAELPGKLNPAQRCKAVKDACPYQDPIKVKAWRSLAANRINPPRSKKPLTHLPGDEAQQAWIDANLR